MDVKNATKKVSDFDKQLELFGKLQTAYNDLYKEYADCVSEIHELNSELQKVLNNPKIGYQREVMRLRKALRPYLQERESIKGRFLQFLDNIKLWKSAVEKLRTKSIDAVGDLFSQLNMNNKTLDNASKEWGKLLSKCDDWIRVIENLFT